MRDHSGSGVVGLQRDGGDITKAVLECFCDVICTDVEQRGIVDSVLFINPQNLETVFERTDVQFLEQGGFRSTNAFTLVDQLEIGFDFNLTTINHGRNVECLEERRLSWVHTSWSLWNKHVTWCTGSCFGSSTNQVVGDLILERHEVSVGKDKADVLANVVDQLIPASLLLDRITTQIKGFWITQAAANHGVLAHQNGSFTAEITTNILKVLGTNIISADQEHFAVFG
mmetsp:Transcript_1750/g.2449  ORF Transcript_1750/g.2449 Transcript_1750/m.2449 type:complete len:228 (-) Transcript_1750:184-867(-)